MKISWSELVERLSEIRLKSVPEENDIHSLIAERLTECGIEFIHECRIAPRRRVDFLVGDIALEVKKGRPARAALLEQLAGYLETDMVSEIIVVTQRQVTLPRQIKGKPVHQLALDRMWGIAL